MGGNDFSLAYGLAKQITRSNGAKEQFEYNRRFWNVIFGKTGRVHLVGNVHTTGQPIGPLLPVISQALPRTGDQARASGYPENIAEEELHNIFLAKVQRQATDGIHE